MEHRIALAQLAPRLGDVSANLELAAGWLHRAASEGAGTSSMKLRPPRMASTRLGSTSTPTTPAPDSAKATARGRPT